MIRIGVALGSNSEPSGICVVERDQRLVLRRQSPGALEIFRAMALKSQGASEESPARSEDDETERHELHFAVRFLQRLPSGTRLTEVVRRLKEVVAGIRRRSEDSVLVYLDVTGKGEPALRLFREEVRDSAIIPVYFNHGDQRIEEAGKVVLGKAALVSQLKILLERHRLHLPRSPDFETLAKDLKDYEVHLAPDASSREGAFKVGTHDELVTALGLTVQGWMTEYRIW